MPRRLAPRGVGLAPLGVRLAPRGVGLAPALALAACGFPRPSDVVADDARGSDAPGSDAALGDALAASDAAPLPDARPGTTIRVAGTGDDANDGITAPVKTLKRAIGLAAASTEITSIALASGRYSTAGGETFPYTLPANLFIVGPAGGGAILAGSNTEPGLIVGSGALQDLELEDFTLAVRVSGEARISNVHVRTRTVALRAETTAALTITDLDIAGAPGACASGIELTGAADLNAMRLVTRGLKTTLNARDQSTATLAHMEATGDRACNTLAAGVITLSTTRSFALNDSQIDDGFNGIRFVSTGTPTQATIKNTTITNLENSALVGSQFALEVTGGEISSSGHAIGAGIANIKLVGVIVKLHRLFVVEIGDGGSFSMRNCMMTDNGGGIYVAGNMTVDLGTAASPGNNVFRNTRNTGVEIEFGVVHVDAVGNTWRPNVQGADSSGRYASARIVGPVGYAEQGNYTVPQNGSLQL